MKERGIYSAESFNLLDAILYHGRLLANVLPVEFGDIEHLHIILDPIPQPFRKSANVHLWKRQPTCGVPQAGIRYTGPFPNHSSCGT